MENRGNELQVTVIELDEIWQWIMGNIVQSDSRYGECPLVEHKGTLTGGHHKAPLLRSDSQTFPINKSGVGT